ncbi:TRAP transporter substrate-binding protein [Psychromarinibacter sp. C21-152]|uniref:TRAP transporter substrate-binding protein n=1 Tax=Psychromarinibacter sediminicola TaxID=3033385 RepID=A0AAE3NPQ8_9RHOB|nr:TRAP transporter substrate-binding protein [Psychromarinibacter sediminicola]MDF0601258.1 TRAP transporter substrate-binding protein [Psychromarinibacter sediminicola]
MLDFITKAPLRRTVSAVVVAASMAGAAYAQDITLRYGHMNAPNSIAGMQADWLAEAIAERTDGAIEVQVFPSSQLGKLQELAEGVSTGTIALSHNTAGAIGSLHPPFAAFDTPYLYRDVDHLMKVVDTDSPVMQQLNEELIEAAGVRVLYAFYFGARNLTADRAIKTPADLEGVKIRSIPFPIYTAAVEGLGAVPVPIDWSEVPTALATGVVSGQENPVNVAVAHKLYEVQSHMMETRHIVAAEVVLINEDTWQGLSDEHKAALQAAAEEVRQKATEYVIASETEDKAKLEELGMTIIGPEDGLDVEAFRASVEERIDAEFGDQYGDFYEQVEAVE